MSAPTFSIVVPTYNRASQLEVCLKAIARLNYPKDAFEVVVVDDGGKRPLDTLVERTLSGVDYTLLRQANAGPGAARNAGVDAAKGLYVAFTDDDCAPREDWLTALKKRIDLNPNAAVAGRTCNALTKNIYSFSSQMLVDYLCEYYNRDQGAGFATTSNIAMPRDRFLAMGGFARAFRSAAGEDRDLVDRWTGAGRKLVYSPDAVVWHRHHLNLFSFAKQHLNYGKAARRFHHLRRARRGEKPSIEGLGFYWGILAYPYRKHVTAPALKVSALMALSQIMNAAGFVFESTPRGPEPQEPDAEHPSEPSPRRAV